MVASMKIRQIVLVLALLPVCGLASAQTRGVTAEDYFGFETLSDPLFGQELSPS